MDLFEHNMFHSPVSKFCNNFQPTIALTLYRLFNATSVFDSSAGWGDRLIAAIALNIKYTGVDPSTCLEPYYKNIIKTLSNNPSNYKIHNAGIEDIDIEENSYDLACSSPPFFDTEIYTDDKTQSINKFKTQQEWEMTFLTILAEQNIKALKSKGYLVLYIPRYKSFMSYMSNHKQLEYKGIFSFYTPRKRDIFVWRKV